MLHTLIKHSYVVYKAMYWSKKMCRFLYYLFLTLTFYSVILTGDSSPKRNWR